MCGLFGMAGPGIKQDDLRLLRELAYISGLRGLDGAGIAQGEVTPRRLTNLQIEKMGSEISYFTWFHERSKEGNRKILNDQKCNFIIGHTRHGTKGEISDENAHPFVAGPIIGAHNGTLWDSKYHHKEKTDSEMMFMDIAERGIETVLSELTSSSAYAISMFDTRNNQLFFAKNEKRPLIYSFNKNRNVMYWASESGMLMLAAYRNGIELGKIFKFSDNYVFFFNPLEVRKDGAMAWTKRKLPEIEKKFVSNLDENILGLPWHHGNRKQTPPSTILIDGEKPTSNVVNISEIKKKASKTTKDHIIKLCVTCRVEMDLYDQFLGTELEANKYRCENCDKVLEGLDKLQLQQGKLN